MDAATEKLTKINEELANGNTIEIHSETRVWRITPKNLAKWAAAGTDLFTVSNGSLFMASGRKRVCIDFNRITVRG